MIKIIGKNYYLISLDGNTELDLLSNKKPHGIFKSISFYNFQVLLNLTRNQKHNTMGSLTDSFFIEMSEHKHKIFFYGTYINNVFTPTSIIYNINHKNIGIYVKKNMIKKFKQYGIDIQCNETQFFPTLTFFKII